MSGDHNMNQTTAGWRKRQIALDKKAENARELGLDYEPSIIEMARRAGAVFPADGSYHKFERHEDLEAFAALVREEERERIAKWYASEGHMMFPVAIPDAIRSNT